MYISYFSWRQLLYAILNIADRYNCGTEPATNDARDIFSRVAFVAIQSTKTLFIGVEGNWPRPTGCWKTDTSGQTDRTLGTHTHTERHTRKDRERETEKEREDLEGQSETTDQRRSRNSINATQRYTSAMSTFIHQLSSIKPSALYTRQFIDVHVSLLRSGRSVLPKAIVTRQRTHLFTVVSAYFVVMTTVFCWLMVIVCISVNKNGNHHW